MANAPAVTEFLRQFDKASLMMGAAQKLTLKICWCEAAKAAPKVELAVPLLKVEDDGVVSLAWLYPEESLVVEVGTKGLAEWHHTTLTGTRKPIWGCLSTGMGIPDKRIRGFIRRRSQAML